MARDDTYREEREHLAHLSDSELHAHFWALAQQIAEPLVELARTHTSPSIERSVLMRMGLDSPTCAAVVAGCVERGVLGHGAGHVVLHCAGLWGVPVAEAGRRLAAGEGWDAVAEKWGGAS